MLTQVDCIGLMLLAGPPSERQGLVSAINDRCILVTPWKLDSCFAIVYSKHWWVVRDPKPCRHCLRFAF